MSFAGVSAKIRTGLANCSTRLPIQTRFSPIYTRFLNTQPVYPGHIPLTRFENAFLAVGSAIMSLADPYRAGMW